MKIIIEVIAKEIAELLKEIKAQLGVVLNIDKIAERMYQLILRG